MPTLSLCMIVKNEEKHLPRCLESVKDWVDEIIVVDTGSTDDTIPIARSFGAAVYDHPWENDFSKHRNQSIGYAGGDWIFWIDADEVLQQASAPLIRQAISRDDIDSLLVTLVNFFNHRMSKSFSNQVRIFKNHCGIHFRGIVHNMPAGYRNTLPCPVFIDHYGYDLDPERMKAKFARTSSLLRRKIRDNPGDFKPRSDLAVSYSMAGMHEEAVAEGTRAIEMALEKENRGGVLVLWTYYIVASSCLKLMDYARAEKYALEALNLNPDHLDSHFILAMTYHQLNAWDRFNGAADRYLEVLEALNTHPETFGYMVSNTANEAWRVHMAKGNARLAEERTGAAEKCFLSALTVAPSRSLGHQTIADFYRKRGLTEYSERHYVMALEIDPVNPKMLLGLAGIYQDTGRNRECLGLIDRVKGLEGLQSREWGAIGLLYLKMGVYESAASALQKATESSPGEPGLHVNLGLALKGLGKTDEAIDANRKALAIHPDSMDALVNLGNIYYEQKRFADATPLYIRAQNRAPDLMDVALRLAWIRLLEGDLVTAVQDCDRILNALRSPVHMQINGLSDLAEIFMIIAGAFREQGQEWLYREAMEMAALMKSNLPGGE